MHYVKQLGLLLLLIEVFIVFKRIPALVKSLRICKCMKSLSYETATLQGLDHFKPIANAPGCNFLLSFKPEV